MFEQDYIMRVIKEMIRTILKLLFNIDVETPTAEILENKQEQEMLENLLNMVDAGKINDAENRLTDLEEELGKDCLGVAILFYSYLNEQTDEFLEKNKFSREEVKQGVEQLVREYGLNGIMEAFLDSI